MQAREKVFLLFIVFAILLLYSGLKNRLSLKNNISLTSINQFNPQTQECPVVKNIAFAKTNNKGDVEERGGNHVIIFDPKAKDLDFKVNVGIAHELYAKDDREKLRKQYIPKQFSELISNKNSTLNGKRPIAAINGDYIDIKNRPEGLNISRGVEYSGVFKSKRSSFGISGGNPEERKATIQIGKRKEELLNYNVIGGNGRFYRDGKFKDICPALGDYICSQTSRSMVAITSKGYVILLVNNAELKKALYPSMFDNVLEGIANNYCLGKIQEGMLFDGGFSTGLYFDNKMYVENPHPVGSVFLIYKK
jgi:hypothetical protein